MLDGLLQLLFSVPPLKTKNVPYTRVNHNKYMVTDNAVYVGECAFTVKINSCEYVRSELTWYAYSIKSCTCMIVYYLHYN